MPQITDLRKSTAKMATGTLISRITGQIRSIMLVLALGTTGLAANSFDIANSLPNTLYIIISGGLLNAILVPQLLLLYQKNNPQRYINQLFTLAGLFILIITIALTIMTPLLIQLYAGINWTSQQIELATNFGYLCLPQIFFYGIYALLGQILATHEKFTAYFYAPVLNNLISIIMLAIFVLLYGPKPINELDVFTSWDSNKIWLLGGGATLGVIGQAICLIAVLVHSGFKFQLAFGLKGFGLRKIAQVGIWSLALVVLEELGALIIFKLIAAAPAWDSSTMDESIAGNAAFNQATTIYIVPYSLIAVSLATALFTKMSKSFAEGDHSEVVRSFSYGVRLGAIFSGFASLFFLVLAIPISRLLIPSLVFEELGIIGWIARWQALGYFGLTVALLAKRLYFAYHQPKRAFWITLPIIGLQILASIIMQGFIGSQHLAEAIALSLSIISTFSVIVYFIDLHKFLKSNLDLARIVIVIVKCLVASILAFFVGASLTLVWVIDLEGNYFMILLQTVIDGVAMLLVYFGILKLLRTKETEYYTERVRNLFRKKASL
ncbi:MAG: hypothetical protein LBC43_02610 [Bifidobacteriaceae bacterium]|jgi:putative peptidoglycan lipid II flippase|nr:hypothetical protein [Bifidobacteriaceae bacterium]